LADNFFVVVIGQLRSPSKHMRCQLGNYIIYPIPDNIYWLAITSRPAINKPNETYQPTNQPTNVLSPTKAFNFALYTSKTTLRITEIKTLASTLHSRDALKLFWTEELVVVASHATHVQLLVL
jgi:hypothetical protein